MLVTAREVGDSTWEAEALSSLGGLYLRQGQDPLALETLQQALTLSRTLGARASERSILFLMSAGYSRLGDAGRALEARQQALALAREPGDRWWEARQLTGAGIGYTALGLYPQALEVLHQALALQQELGLRREAGQTLEALSTVHRELGQYPTALAVLEQFLTVTQEIRDRRWEGHARTRIGATYTQLGQPAKALEAHQQGLTLAREVKDQQHEGESLLQLGGAYQALGQLEPAREFYQHALALYRTLGDRRGEAPTLIQLGAVYRALGQLDRALEPLQQALTIVRELGNRWEERNALAHLGTVYAQRGQLDAALDAYQQALLIAQDAGDRRLEGVALAGLGAVYAQRGQHARALETYQHALPLHQATADQEGLGRSSAGIARALTQLGRSADALTYYDSAIQTIESLRDHIRGAVLRRDFLTDKLQLYREVVTLLLTLPPEVAPPASAEKAFHYAQHGKARTLLEQLAEARAGVRKGIAPRLRAQEHDLYNQLLAAHQRLREPWPVDQRTTWQKQYTELTRQFTALQQQLYTEAPLYAALHYPQPLTVDQVKDVLLRDGEVLLEYCWGTDGLYLFVIDRTHSLRVIPLPEVPNEQELTARISQWLEPFRDVDSSMDQRTREDGLQHVDWRLAHTFYQQLVHPAVRDLPAGTTLLIIPDGVLHSLPFELLVTHLSPGPGGQSPAAARHRDATYLVSRHPIVYAPAVSVLDPELLHHGQRQAPPKMLLALAPFAQPTMLEKLAAWVGQLRQGDPLRAREGGLWLRHSGREVLAIQAMFPTDTTTFFFEAQATKHVLHTQAQEYRYLHLATHGVLDPKRPLASGLLFADGLLQAQEIFNLELHADLVVLSACQSGLGVLQPGEGLVGLTQAFLYAGTPSVVASLWRVDDAITAQFMQNFYRHLRAGVPKAQALQQAKIAALRYHPFYWAPFVLVGDWR